MALDSLVFQDDIIVVAEGHRRNQASWELRHWPSRDRVGPPVRRCEPRLAHVRGSSSACDSRMILVAAHQSAAKDAGA